MVSMYNKNCILTGVADSLCLSCQIYLKVGDLKEHIESSVHRTTLKSLSYVKKYKKDSIWKVNQGYYCELCNILIKAVAKLQIHIKDCSHVKSRNDNLVRGCNEGIIVFDDILIEMEAWHGWCNGSCVICNIDCDHSNDHRNTPSHVINIIQAKLDLSDSMVYRMIEENLIHCLICNILVDLDSKQSHGRTADHWTEYAKCQKSLKKVKTKNYGFNVISNNVHANIVSTTAKGTSASIKNFAKGEESTRTAVEVDKSKNQDSIEITSTEKKSDENVNILLPSEALQRSKKFAKQNCMKYKRNGTYCQVCNIKISSSFRVMKEHVTESRHKENVAKVKPLEVNAKKKITMNFIYTGFDVKNSFLHIFVINNCICISYISFHMIIKLGNRYRCHTCEESFLLNEREIHETMYRHHCAIQRTPVLTDFKNEFIREVRPGVFHCGFCNFIDAGLAGLQNHLMSIEHKAQKEEKQRLLPFLLALHKHQNNH